MRRGITVTSAAVMVVIILILLGIVSITSYNSIQNANKLVFAIEIAEIQEEVTSYYKDSMDGIYPLSEKVYTVDVSQVTTDSISQFDLETKDVNGQITLYEIDLTTIGITDTTFGNKENEKDVYVVSIETGKVYYLDGLKVSDKTYYTLTEDLIDIKDRNEKNIDTESIVTKPYIDTVGIVTKTLSSGTEEFYLSDIKITGNGITIAKYEVGLIDEEIATTYFKNSGSDINNDRIKLKDDTTVTLYVENSNGEYDIKYRGYPLIPEGFVVSDLESENEVSEGLVIYEGTEIVSNDIDAQTTRNQFVWVPVNDIDQFVRNEGYSNGSLQNFSTANEPYSAGYASEVQEYNSMLASVEKYGGFYIARYEAGTTNARTKKANGTTDLLIQKNKKVYNFVGWGASSTEIDGDVADYDNGYNQGKGAVILSRDLYNNDDIVSTLVYGVQWDATIDFIKNIENQNVDGKKFFEDSTDMGVYGLSSPAVTGSNDNYKVKNIYDLAGNVGEWTMEYYTPGRVYRGGYFSKTGVSNPVSNRERLVGNVARNYVGFRIALYLK